MTGSVVFLPCTDIREIHDFFHGILGLPVHQKQGDDLYIFDTGYGYWGFCQYTDGRKTLGGPQGVCLSIDLGSNEDVLAKYEELKGRCRIYKEPARHPVFPVYSFFVMGPDDYLVEFPKRA